METEMGFAVELIACKASRGFGSDLHRVAAGKRFKEFLLVELLALQNAFLPLGEFAQN